MNGIARLSCVGPGAPRRLSARHARMRRSVSVRQMFLNHISPSSLLRVFPTATDVAIGYLLIARGGKFPTCRFVQSTNRQVGNSPPTAGRRRADPAESDRRARRRRPPATLGCHFPAPRLVAPRRLRCVLVSHEHRPVQRLARLPRYLAVRARRHGPLLPARRRATLSARAAPLEATVRRIWIAWTSSSRFQPRLAEHAPRPCDVRVLPRHRHARQLRFHLDDRAARRPFLRRRTRHVRQRTAHGRRTS